ncbi:hypothetical protein FQK07_00060 [Synechococcus sp. BSF8S]|uniref:proton-conducting transporter transmembrane domain-containing protein n=1 Tax=Synechococcales TaxID=1890424 RepID=UPI00162634DD|nr:MULTISPECIES: proton-conducting transporter membrane subunit [unclassified Synechococcus]MBC1259681.1 hypothetical protein [Synechococcus sp. BSF8S]MBC1262896.1 hypothetical protein [Synechococcus sp. BSA11S]
MNALLIGWLLLPFLLAFSSALRPKLGWWMALICCTATLVVGLALGFAPEAIRIQLVGPFGVSLLLDGFLTPFLVLNALVGAAVLLDRGQSQEDPSFCLLLMALHGSINSALVCHDLISLYVALEVVSLCAFLLIADRHRVQSLWIALRYLLVGSTALLFYLIGCAQIHASHGSFGFEGVRGATAGPLALLLVGLLTKSGLFISGLWLPRTHAEAPAQVSALLSGVVITAGAAPLMRLAQASSAIGSVVLWLGLASTGFAVVFALLEPDVKRLLAWSTVSQVGLVVLSPLTAGLFALGHGIAKACLFLLARHFPSRRLEDWEEMPLPFSVALPMRLAALSIAGCPLLVGYLAKERLQLELGPLPALLVTVFSVGTAAVYTRLWASPIQRVPSGWTWPVSWGVTLLVAGLVLSNGLPLMGHDSLPWLASLKPASLGKSLGVLLAGWAVHRLIQPFRAQLRLPDVERFDDLIGSMGIMGTAIVVMLLW